MTSCGCERIATRWLTDQSARGRTRTRGDDTIITHAARTCTVRFGVVLFCLLIVIKRRASNRRERTRPSIPRSRVCDPSYTPYTDDRVVDPQIVRPVNQHGGHSQRRRRRRRGSGGGGGGGGGCDGYGVGDGGPIPCDRPREYKVSGTLHCFRRPSNGGYILRFNFFFFFLICRPHSLSGYNNN